MRRRNLIKLVGATILGNILGSITLFKSVYAKSFEITRIVLPPIKFRGVFYTNAYLQIRFDSPETYNPDLTTSYWHIVLEIKIPDPVRPGREITLAKKHVDLGKPKDFWEALSRHRFVVTYLTIDPKVFCDNVFNKYKVVRPICSLNDEEHGGCTGIWCRIPELTKY